MNIHDHIAAVTGAMRRVADVAHDIHNHRVAGLDQSDVELAAQALEDALDDFAVAASDDHTDCLSGLQKALVYALDNARSAKQGRGE